jgi:hypothetical protein
MDPANERLTYLIVQAGFNFLDRQVVDNQR